MRCLPVDLSPQNPVYQQTVHEAWKDFIDGGEIRGRVPDHILDGWLLSRDARIDPVRAPDVPVLERGHFADLCSQSAVLLNACLLYSSSRAPRSGGSPACLQPQERDRPAGWGRR